MPLLNIKLRCQRWPYFFGIFAVPFVLFIIFWVYGIYRDMTIINHLENNKKSSQNAIIFVDSYDWFFRRFYLRVETGTFSKPRPLSRESLGLLRKMRIGGISFLGDSIDRKDFNDFLEIDAEEWLSFFFEKIEGESTIRVPVRFIRRFELHVSGLNEQEMVSLAENISAEDMVITTAKSYNQFFLSSEALYYILRVNQSKNIVLGNVEIIPDNNNTQFRPVKNSGHCYQCITLFDCSPLDEIIKIAKEIDTDSLIFFSSTIDFEGFQKELSAYKFDHAKSVIAKGIYD